jgi:hypothetical protein
MKSNPARSFWISFAAFMVLGPIAAARDQSPEVPPAELVRKAVQNEIAANSDSGMHFMFRDQRKTPHTMQTKLMVETRDAIAGLVVAQDGHPLTAEQRRAEEARLENYVANPEELRKKRKQDKEDAERTIRIVKALPDAFLYEHDGTEQGNVGLGGTGHELVRLKFRPNPGYNPPSREEQVLVGMEGHLLLDSTENRIAKIDGMLEKQVSFGWGILGHLNRGGRFLVQQADVGNHQWEVTRMELSFTGKILLFKNLSIRSSEVFSDFHPVPSNLTFAQGVELLKKEIARDQSAARAKEEKQAERQAQPRTEPQAKEQAEENVCCDR